MVVLLSLAACTDDTEYTAGVWYRRSDFDGVARTDAAGFTIGNGSGKIHYGQIACVGNGLSGKYSCSAYTKDIG